MWSAWPKFRANGARTAGANESAAAFRPRIFCAPGWRIGTVAAAKNRCGAECCRPGAKHARRKAPNPIAQFFRCARFIPESARRIMRMSERHAARCRKAPDSGHCKAGLGKAPQSLPECACFCRNMEIPGVLSFRDWIGKPTRRVLPLRPEFRPPARFPFPYLCQSQNLFKNPQFPAVSLPDSKKTPPSLPSPAPQASL